MFRVLHREMEVRFKARLFEKEKPDSHKKLMFM